MRENQNLKSAHFISFLHTPSTWGYFKPDFYSWSNDGFSRPVQRLWFCTHVSGIESLILSRLQNLYIQQINNMIWQSSWLWNHEWMSYIKNEYKWMPNLSCGSWKTRTKQSWPEVIRYICTKEKKNHHKNLTPPPPPPEKRKPKQPPIKPRNSWVSFPHKEKLACICWEKLQTWIFRPWWRMISRWVVHVWWCFQLQTVVLATNTWFDFQMIILWVFG